MYYEGGMRGESTSSSYTVVLVVLSITDEGNRRLLKRHYELVFPSNLSILLSG